MDKTFYLDPPLCQSLGAEYFLADMITIAADELLRQAGNRFDSTQTGMLSGLSQVTLQRDEIDAPGWYNLVC